jgi:hypothetical protein
MARQGRRIGSTTIRGDPVSKKAQVYSVRIAGDSSFAWKWRSADGARQSPGAFVYFFDCVTDAKKSGYAVDLVPAHGAGAPGTVDGKGAI